MQNKIALVIGHSAQLPGARGVPPLAAEYFYNIDLANEIKEAFDANKIACQIFTRNVVGLNGAYAAVNVYKPDLAIELHYNSFDRRARGTETLFGDRNTTSKRLAECVQTSMIHGLERGQEFDRGTKKLSKDDRGFSNVNSADCPSCLIEPFFGDNIDDARLGREKKTNLVKAIVEAVNSFLNQG